jgi:hypothetical protein
MVGLTTDKNNFDSLNLSTAIQIVLISVDATLYQNAGANLVT